jgi:hypothetical protein
MDLSSAADAVDPNASSPPWCAGGGSAKSKKNRGRGRMVRQSSNMSAAGSSSTALTAGALRGRCRPRAGYRVEEAGLGHERGSVLASLAA